MQISAVQSQLTNSTQGMQIKKTNHSIGMAKDLVSDSVSFKSTKSEAAGWAGAIGTIAAACAVGAFLPVIAPIAAIGALLGGAVVGNHVQQKVEEKEGQGKS